MPMCHKMLINAFDKRILSQSRTHQLDPGQIHHGDSAKSPLPNPWLPEAAGSKITLVSNLLFGEPRH